MAVSSHLILPLCSIEARALYPIGRCSKTTERFQCDCLWVRNDAITNINHVNQPLILILIKLIESSGCEKSIDSLNHFVCSAHSIHIFNSIKCVKLSMESESISTGQLSYTRTPELPLMGGRAATIHKSISTMQSSSITASCTHARWYWVIERVESRRSLKIIHPLLTTEIALNAKSAQMHTMHGYEINFNQVIGRFICHLLWLWLFIENPLVIFETIRTEHSLSWVNKTNNVNTKNRIYQMDFPIKEHSGLSKEENVDVTKVWQRCGQCADFKKAFIRSQRLGTLRH